MEPMSELYLRVTRRDVDWSDYPDYQENTDKNFLFKMKKRPGKGAIKRKNLKKRFKKERQIAEKQSPSGRGGEKVEINITVNTFIKKVVNNKLVVIVEKNEKDDDADSDIEVLN